MTIISVQRMQEALLSVSHINVAIIFKEGRSLVGSFDRILATGSIFVSNVSKSHHMNNPFYTM